MDIEKRLDLIRGVGEEIITEEELRSLLEEKKHPVAYDGFEPSGNVHIAQGILRSINVNKMIKAGCKFKMYAADWHGWANNKMGGDLNKIQKVGDYLVEIWKASGMNLNDVEIVRASEIVDSQEYWKKVMKIALNSTVKRVIRCGQIMGRKESEVQRASQIIYPCMQAADIFHLKADIAQLGMDQRKVNMLAREVGPKIGFWKPVAVHHHMLMGLSQPPKGEGIDHKIEIKMSKTKPDTAIFMTDSENEIKGKISKAYCPGKQIEENPIIEYCKYIIFEKYSSIEIKRPPKFGGNLELNNFEELVNEYSSGKLHPEDLKKSVAYYINDLILPVRKHFEKNKKANELQKSVLKEVRLC